MNTEAKQKILGVIEDNAMFITASLLMVAMMLDKFLIYGGL